MGLLWEGARALGLHPWSPDVQNLAPHQLWWVILQSREGMGLAPRRKLVEDEMAEKSKTAAELVVWADAHVTRRPR